jgi:hypothetical protein
MIVMTSQVEEPLLGMLTKSKKTMSKESLNLKEMTILTRKR